MYGLISIAKRTVGNRTRPSYIDMFDDLGLWIVDSIRVGIWGLDRAYSSLVRILFLSIVLTVDFNSR
jgi:hypothetical protein